MSKCITLQLLLPLYFCSQHKKSISLILFQVELSLIISIIQIQGIKKKKKQHKTKQIITHRRIFHIVNITIDRAKSFFMSK